MIKRLGMLAAAFALAALPAFAVITPLNAYAACPTGVTATTCATANFAISATVNPTATLTFGTGTTAFTQYTWANVTDNTTQYLAADNDPVKNPTVSPTINASLRTSAGTGGGGSIFFVTPSGATNVPGSGTNTIPFNTFAYGCSGSYQPATPPGGTAPSAQNITDTTATPTAVAAGSNTGCSITFAAGQSIASTSIQLSLYLDDRSVPADTYTLTGFQVVVSAS